MLEIKVRANGAGAVAQLKSTCSSWRELKITAGMNSQLQLTRHAVSEAEAGVVGSCRLGWVSSLSSAEATGAETLWTVFLQGVLKVSSSSVHEPMGAELQSFHLGIFPWK